MSLINDFLEKVTGLDLDGSDSPKTTERPCSNCPANCAIAGTACQVCAPYKRKLIDAVYHVDHIDEYYDRYEVVSTPAEVSRGTTHCPFCGANSEDPYTCEYCGSRLAEKPASSGKIQVSSASEIPNPIMEAQNIIWERYAAVIKKSADGSPSSGGFLSDLVSMFTGSDEDKDRSALGAKMSEAEIREAALLYHVSVGDYLTGLDNGKYLTLSGKKAVDAQRQSSSAPQSSAGIPGLASIGMLAAELLSSSISQRRPRRPSSQPVSLDFPFFPSQSGQRPSSGNSGRRRPSRPENDPFSNRDFPARPSSGNSERRRPENKPSSVRPPERPQRPSSEQRVKPQESRTPSRSGGPSHERHPENRRSGSGGSSRG